MTCEPDWVQPANVWSSPCFTNSLPVPYCYPIVWSGLCSMFYSQLSDPLLTFQHSYSAERIAISLYCKPPLMGAAKLRSTKSATHFSLEAALQWQESSLQHRAWMTEYQQPVVAVGSKAVHLISKGCQEWSRSFKSSEPSLTKIPKTTTMKGLLFNPHYVETLGILDTQVKLGKKKNQGWLSFSLYWNGLIAIN